MGKDSDTAIIGRAMKQLKRERGERNLAAADPSGWTKHMPYHWSREFRGRRLDYWPSRNRFQYAGKVMTGDVVAWMRKRS